VVNQFHRLQERVQKLLERWSPRLQTRLKEFLRNPTNIQSVGLWAAALIAGLISVGYAMVFRVLDQLFHQVILQEHAAWSFLVTPLLFLAAWYLVRRFSPEAAGSGIPQIMAANEMEYKGATAVHVDRLLSVRTAVVKVCSSLLCVLGGGAIGREGPTLQISSSVFHYFGKWVRRWVPDANAQTWVVAGAAAGLASAFNTPLGGIVYAIEELGIVHFHRVRTALLSAVIISGLVAQWLLGSYLYLGFPELQGLTFAFLPVALFTGLLAGYLGGVFGHLLFLLLELRQKYVDNKHLALITLFTGFGMAALFQFTPLAAGTGIELITGYLFHDIPANPLLIVVRFFATMLSYLSGAAGGIFSPSLAVGATIGATMASWFHTQHPHLMVMLGMIGFLTGVTRTPFTSFILVLEMTDRHAAIFPMMLVAVTAQWAAQFADDHSFYELVKRKWLVTENAT
jgi:H+/Cl- antiporter ClcA